MHQRQPAGPGDRLLVQTLQGPEEVVPLQQRHVPRVGAAVEPRGQDRRDRGTVHRRVLGEDQPLELLQGRPGVDAQLVGEGGAGPLVGGERVGLAAGAVLRAHEQRPERLAHRVPAHQGLELRDRRRDTGSPEIGRDAAFEGIQPQRTQALGLGLEQLAAGELGVRAAPPQAERVGQGVAGLVDAAVEQCRAAPSDLALEDESVDVVGRDVEDVAVPAGADDVGHAEVTAQPRDVGLQGRGGRCRRLRAPEPVHQPVVTHLMPGSEREQRQQPPRQLPADVDRAAAMTDFERPKDPDLHLIDGRHAAPRPAGEKYPGWLACRRLAGPGTTVCGAPPTGGRVELSKEPVMTTTTATSTDLRGASTSTYKSGSRRPSRRTTWILAGAAAVAITAGSVVVGLQVADDDPPTGVGASVSSAVVNDPAGPQHGLGPVSPSVARHAASIEATQVAHGTAGALSDAAGRPLLP